MLVERERIVDPDDLDPVNELDAGRTVQDDGSAISWAVTPPHPIPFLDGLSDELRAEVEKGNIVDFPKKTGTD